MKLTYQISPIPGQNQGNFNKTFHLITYIQNLSHENTKIV
jgi:hypothetical protein